MQINCITVNELLSYKNKYFWDLNIDPILKNLKFKIQKEYSNFGKLQFLTVTVKRENIPSSKSMNMFLN